MSDVIQPFIRTLVRDIETGQSKGWEVFKANESYSVRTYMATKYLSTSVHLELPPQHLHTNVINWCEHLAGVSEYALTETVFSFLASAEVGNTNFGDVQ
ncbi:hypothetical protein J3R83DRAFT_3171 [Lanmaoa asiatica]|nr:hypothetical protein J3R83DRAFT_3171 [Lanmaoa asiatica]